MPTPPLSDTEVIRTVEVYRRLYRQRGKVAKELGISKSSLANRLKVAAQRGFLLDESPAMPGFRVSQVTTSPRGQSIQQRPEHGPEFEVPEGHLVKGVSTLTDPDGRTIAQWTKTAADDKQREEAFRAFIEGLKDDIPRAEPVAAPAEHGDADLLNQYTITDSHLGMLAWGEEAGEDYDLATAERLLTNFFASAVEWAPPAHTGILAQLGDLLHQDSHIPLTPASGNVLDVDTRLQKVIRAVIRVLRAAIARLLDKHEHVHVIMADANHDPTAGAWLREMFAAFYGDEPRITVDTSPATYYCYEHGDTALFFSHGHRRGMKDVDAVFAGRFREVFGRSKHAYAHLGHRHSDALRTSHLMKIEQHETLAAKDAFAAQGGFPGGRSAKVITYHRAYGEVSRLVIKPQMLE